jgi:lipopolysaccharide export system protein LptA
MRFYKVFLYLSFSLFSIVQGQENLSLPKEDSMVVNSGEAQYDGKEIVLVGEVVVQHPLGQISSHRLSVQPSIEQGKKNKFGFLRISDDVAIELKGGGQLYCQQAEIDYGKMQGIFLGNLTHPDVIYLNTGEGQENADKARLPFEIKSIQMTLELIREMDPSSSTKILVKQIEADQNVRVSFNQDYLLVADHAVYQRIPTAPSSSIAGLLTLSVREHLPACKITNLNGDNLSAQIIQLNTIERKLWFSQSKGMLCMQREGNPAQNLEFSSKELVWDDLQQTLLLKGDIRLTQNNLRLQTDHELLIARANLEGEKNLKYFQAPKNSHISYLDVQKGDTHQIYCPGPLMMDHEHQKMELQGAIGPPYQQVCIEDVLGEIYADRVQMNYVWQDNQLIPEKMILEGHVHLMNRFDGHLEEVGSVLHYALADRVEYFLKQQEMVLTSTKDSRVLFFDRVNNVQMSAPHLKVWRDPTTQKEMIQGLGDVRFTFMEKEFEQLKRHFTLTDVSQKEHKSAKSKEK